MLTDQIKNPNEKNENFLTNPLFECKYQISLLSYYLILTFDAINTALEQCEVLIKEFNKIKQNKILSKTENSSSLNSEYISTDDKSEDLLEPFKDFYEKKKIGKYHWKVRAMKIIKYKVKQIIRQGKVPISSKYSGRSKVASQKPRCHGRFIKVSK
jgi:hypothetical protein